MLLWCNPVGSSMGLNKPELDAEKDAQIQALIKGEYLGTEDIAFKSFISMLPEKHWSKYDLSAVRLGWEAKKAEL